MPCDFIWPPADRNDDSRVIASCWEVMEMQFLEILAVMRYHAKASLHGIGKLL